MTNANTSSGGLGQQANNTRFRRRREGKVRPFQGNAPHGQILRGPDFSTIEGAFATIPSPPLRNALAKNIGAPRLRFLRHRGIYQSDVGLLSNPSLSWNRCLPPAAPDPSSRTRREEHALLIVPMSSGRLFLDRVGRHQSPSPLHRHAQTNTHFPSHYSKPELSILLGRGTFYFALTLKVLSRVRDTHGTNSVVSFFVSFILA